MKTFLLGLTLLSVATALKCYVGADSATAASADCADADAVKCKGPPALVDYVPVVGAYACGACEANTAATCLDCDEADCNAPATEEYECATYAWVTDAWVAQDAKAKCAVAKDGDAVCNGPGANAKEADSAATGNPLGCGPCAALEDGAEDPGLCASASTITTLLAVVAIIYNLF